MQLAAAVSDLERESQAYLSQPDYVAARHRAETLRSGFAAYRKHGDELVQSADSRKEPLKEFWSRFEALDARTKASLAGSWKIFGRVIARKSLVDLNTSLDAIRRGFASLPITEGYDQGALNDVTENETGLAATLRKRLVTRSQGEAWVLQMRANLAQIGTLQETLIRIDSRRRDLLQQHKSRAPTTGARGLDEAALGDGGAACCRRPSLDEQGQRDLNRWMRCLCTWARRLLRAAQAGRSTDARPGAPRSR